MGRPKKRRARTSHVGIKLVKRRWSSGTESWLARYRDPDTGKPAEVSLTALGKHSEQARRKWAIDKSNWLASRRAEIKSGIAVLTRTPVAEAITVYFEGIKAEGLKETTVAAYRSGTNPFTHWCSDNGVDFVESVTGPMLSRFRRWYVSVPAHEPLRGKGKRFRWAAGSRQRSPAQINKGLNSLRVVLNQLRRDGLCPSLSSDLIRDSLAYVKTPKRAPQFLRSDGVRSLLQATRKHDEDTFERTRDGRTNKARYAPIRPFVIAVLLSGMRFSECASLMWAHVDLVQWEIRLPHTATKTGHARTISLKETPALHDLLLRMKVKAAGNPFVFGVATTNDQGSVEFAAYSRDLAESARNRLVNDYGAPAFTWHDLRRTCGTYLTCAPGIYGGASAFMSAKRLGHSVIVSERHYAGQVSGIPPHAATLEAALGVEDLLRRQPGEPRSVVPTSAPAFTA